MHTPLPPTIGATTRTSAEALKDIMAVSIMATELLHVRVQLRLVAVLLAATIAFELADPALLLLSGDGRSIIERTAAVAALGTLGAGLVFVALAGLLLPFVATQCGLWPSARRSAAKLACVALSIAALLWFFLAWRAMPLNLGAAASLLFIRNGAGAITFALAIALSLNAELLRKLEHST